MTEKNPINIDRLIDLGSFEVTGAEKQQFEGELADFLEYARVINGAPQHLPPASHAVDKEQLLRADEASPWKERESLIGNAPALQGTSYLVPPLAGISGTAREQEPRTGKPGSGDYEVVIGLEVHAQLNTSTKLFCSCPTSFGSDPNSNTCPVCSGQPGALPVLNREAVSMAIMAGLAMGCAINGRSLFARKNYFYPDLPKGYQISQFEEPICSGGVVEIELDKATRKIRLNRIHVEEDAGKLVHVGAPGIWGSKASAVDYNRSSVPLIEIVSEPDISSPAEAREFMVMLRAILVTLGICNGNMEEGNLRCDANVSLRERGDTELGVKVEIKNMNSLKAIERALAYEITRLEQMKRAGTPIEQETRLWDDSSQKTALMRSKEESHDYRYFPDPDLLPLTVTDEWIESVRRALPPMPLERKNRYEREFSFTESEARLFMVNPAYAAFFEKALLSYGNARNLANWLFSELLSHEDDFDRLHVTPEDFAKFLKKIDSGEISGRQGKDILRRAFADRKGIIEIIESEGHAQITDRASIEKAVDNVIASHPDQVAEYRSGKTRVLGYLVGAVMKATGGKANPALVNEVLTEKLKG
ncbi:MAG TPA: Asp-tRNA(Asn)/Glu-tRNA(Gln) amidotransferase subunit GatB [Spirochaetota bacterium]|mgnify:FL=1|nr:Asp-tRNA(Asn)/Glu-tRNA(Gln) amidotransferase subunit GatB [Spirochaetota bacterium]HQH96171.1 Asp-tRNA(Asn)/Glu-tRNA(Gln) amidotransferase subunit GatB [Spirochaetota bacterium]